METWELWDDLPATIINRGVRYTLELTKGGGLNCVRYISEGQVLMSSYDIELHEALDRLWLWWQDYEVKK